MCRGVFAITWFLLLGITLTNMYLAYAKLLSSELKNQGDLMDAEEAFYKARNFEFDFKRAVASGETKEFYDYWSSQGSLVYGSFQEFPEKHCKQTDDSFELFLSKTLSENPLLFSPIGQEQACVTLAVEYGKFKTFGIIKSTVCINTSSRLFLC